MNQSFEQVLSRLKSALPRQITEHEILRVSAEMTGVRSSQGADSIRKEVLRWAEKKTVGRLPPAAWAGDSFEHLVSGRHCIGVKVNVDESHLWGVRVDDPDKNVPGRVWSTEIAVGETGENRASFSLRLLLATSEDQLDLQPCSPGVVLQVARRGELTAGGYKVASDVGVVRSNEDLQALVDELVDSKRVLPVIVLTTCSDAEDEEKPSIEVEALRRATAGIARIAVIPARFTWALSNRFGKRLSVYEGASRIYSPGFSADSNPFQGHDLFVPRDPLDAAEGQRIASRIQWTVAKASVRRFALGRDVLSFATLRSKSLQRRQQELTLAGASDKEQLIAAGQRIKSLEEQLEAGQSDQLLLLNLSSEVEERARNAEAQLRAAGFRIQQLLEQIRTTGASPDTNIALLESWEDFAEWCDTYLGGRVILAPQARRSLKSAEFVDVVTAAECLLWLANEFRLAKVEGADGTLRDAPVKSGLLNAHCGDDQFEMEWQGKRCMVDWHIKNNGNTRDPSRCLRIYYFWDESSQQSVIASMPAHRRTSAS